MKHKNSILICELDTGELNLYVNGAAVYANGKFICPVDKITNSELDNQGVKERLRDILNLVDNLQVIQYPDSCK